MISSRRKLVEQDVNTDEAPVTEDVSRWPDAAGSGSPYPDSVRRPFISFKTKEPTFSSLVDFVGWVMRTDEQLVPITPKDGARRAGRRQLGAQRGAMVSEGGAGEEEESNHSAGCLWPFRVATLGAQQIGAQGEAMVDEEEAGEEEGIKRTAGRLWPIGNAMLGARHVGAQRGVMMDEEAAEKDDIHHIARPLCPFAKADAVAAGQTPEEPDVGENGINSRPTSVISKKRVQREALSIIITRRTISTRQHPVEDEIDPEVTFKTLPRATTAAVAKPWTRTTATRGGIAMASGRVTDWAHSIDIGLITPTSTPTFGRETFTPITSGRGAMPLSGSGRGLMRLDDPGCTGVRRNELATLGRSGRSSRASVRSVDMAELESRLGK